MKAVAEQLACFHCGDECLREAIRYDDHTFCCEGCRTVYQLLNESDLCRYYTLDQAAGVKMDRPLSPGRFAFLDDPEIARPLYQYYSARDARVLFFIPEMHCASCIWLLERLYKLLPGIIHSRVNFDRKEIMIRFDPSELSLRLLVEKLSALGYEPALIEQHKAPGSNKALLYRLGVAGFCAGNIMLFSFPEYLGMDEFSHQEFSGLFQGLSALLSIPVVAFSAQPIFKKAWQGLKSRTLNIDFPLALGIAALFIRSLAELGLGEGPGFFDSLAMLVFFLLIGRWLQDRAYESLSFERDYKSYFPLAAEVETGDGSRYTSITELKVGDLVRIKSQELIPADARILSGEALIDYSFVNGESSPEKLQPGDTVYAGGRQLGGLLRIQILKPVSQSYLSSLWNQQESVESKRVKSFSDLIGRYFTLVLVLIASGTLIYWLPRDTGTAFDAFTAVLIVACPCVLVVAAPFAFGNAMRFLAKRGIFLKNPETVETVAETDCVVFDKTGTLTEKSAGVRLLQVAPDAEIPGRVAGIVSQSVHPNSRMILEFLELEEFPSTDHFEELAGKGLVAEYGCEKWRIGSETWISGISETELDTRVLAERNGEVVAVFELQWHFRKELDELFRHWQVPKYLYSGDRARGVEILSQWFAPETMYFECSPDDKLKAMQELRRQGFRPLMVGDGLNDAGALKESWAGVAITGDAHAFTPACDVIMVDKSLADLRRFITFCKQTMKTVRFSFLFSLVYNLIWMGFAVQGTLEPLVAALLMPLSSITVLSINTLGIRYFARKGGIS